VAVKEWNDQIIFLRKLVEGSVNRSYGIQVARLAGLPLDVISKAKEILAKLEKGEIALRGTDANQLPLFSTDSVNHLSTSEVDGGSGVIIDELKAVDLDTLTPIEALNVLHKLKSLIS